MTSSQYHKERYARLVAGKLCVDCGMAEVNTFTLCLDCRAKRQKMERVRRNKHKQPCVVCTAPRSQTSVTGMCKLCALNAASKKRWAGHTRMTLRDKYLKRKLSQLAYLADQYAYNKQHGLCVRCGKVPTDRYAQCDPCRARKRTLYREKHRERG
jgi:hypothetical protein